MLFGAGGERRAIHQPWCIIVLFFPRPGKKCNWLDRNLSPRVEEIRARGMHRDARERGREEARVRAGRPSVITMIRNDETVHGKNEQGGTEREPCREVPSTPSQNGGR